jgi:hypothetical protein
LGVYSNVRRKAKKNLGKAALPLLEQLVQTGGHHLHAQVEIFLWKTKSVKNQFNNK